MEEKHFKKIFNAHYEKLARYVDEIVNDKEVAHEIASECFVKLWDSMSTYDDENSITSFLRMHARNAAIDYLRQNERINTQDLMYRDKPLESLEEIYNRVEKSPARIKEVVLLSLRGLSIKEIALELDISREAVFRLRYTAFKFLRLHENKSQSIAEQISIIKDEINAELIKYFAGNPHRMHDLSARKFEELVAALMKGMGYDVYLNSHTRDGGRDIIAVMSTLSNDKMVTIVQCKRNAADNLVGIDIVERFIYTIREKDRANAGWIITTSSFSRDAQKLQKEYEWQLSLKDNKNLEAWCSNYGQWTKSGDGGLWLPNNPLA
jgi:RNA polymerase sigma factor (sigma-70 family)